MKRQILYGALAVLLALWAGASYVLYAQTLTAAELRSQLASRFEVVALQQGIALVPRQVNPRARMIQIVDGAVTVDGQVMTAAQLRERLGPDANPVIQLTFLDGAALRQLAAPTAPSPAVTPVEGPPAPPSPPTAVDTSRPVRRQGDIVKIGGSVNVARDERVQGDVVAVFGPAVIDGEVAGDVVAVMGPITLGPTAVVSGDLTAVGGPLTRAPGSRVSGQVNEVSLGGAGGGGSRRFGMPTVFGSLRDRVGSLALTVARLLLVILLGLIAIAVIRHPVEQVAARAAADPLRSALVGLLAEILFVPVLVVTIFALVVSIVGIPLLVLVPFAVLLIGLIMFVGFTGAAYQVGGIVLQRFGRGGDSPYLALAAGVLVIAAVTVAAKLLSIAGGFFVGVPFAFVGYLIEYLAWTMGFGAAILAWFNLRKRRAVMATTAGTVVAGEA